MLSNEYRRALIMLRALQRGYSGHARLEKRTTMGSLSFVINAERMRGRLYAALVGLRRGDYYAASLGELRSGGRGQAGGVYTFDPRNIAGKPLEDYRLLVVLNIADSKCDLVLSGNIDGSFEVDWGKARAAACALYEVSAPTEMEAEPAQETMNAASFIQTDSKQTEVVVEPIEMPEENEKQNAVSFEENPDADSEEAATSGEIWIDVKAVSPSQSTQQTETGEEESAETDETQERALLPTAFELLRADPEAEWPQSLEAVRALFSMSSPFEPFEAEGYIFVRAPLPEASGYSYCAVGIRTADGKPNSVCYALPAVYSPEPPAGLEGYVWRGDAANGWWVIFLDAESGEELEN